MIMFQGRQIGSAERLRLKERLFEPKNEGEEQTTVAVSKTESLRSIRNQMLAFLPYL